MRVRCNHCMNEFDESEIITKEDEEFCPFCNKSDALMDLI